MVMIVDGHGRGKPLTKKISTTAWRAKPVRV